MAICMWNTQRVKRQLLLAAIAGSFALANPSSLLAADCGCEVECGCEAISSGCGCEIETPACGCEMEMPTCGSEISTCDGGCGTPSKHNPIYRSLDAVAGGIEKLFGLDKRHKGCDESYCDAMMMGEVMMPMPQSGTIYASPTPAPSPIHHGHSHAAPMSPPLPPAEVPSTGSIEVQPKGPRQWQSSPMSKARLVPTPSQGQHLGRPQASRQPIVDPTPATQSRSHQWPALTDQPESRSSIGSGVASPVPEPMSDTPQPRRDAAPETSDEGESLFDALSNPFSDDEVHVRRYQAVRPSNYQSSRPVPSPSTDDRQQELSKSYRQSSRRSANPSPSQSAPLTANGYSSRRSNSR
ncbi:hypothetical protein Pla22_04890 [Rubripirellula amarantea]|uniref:Uncharacterized protein n=1 Tax=Rubripirellula amarantea TaxID=2527999 RepID=A0A5C5WRT8_9BACT|nr:hypothetical protein Pla22_04890 [Rubripirellula amarantea]